MARKNPLWYHTNENNIDMAEALTVSARLGIDVRGGLTDIQFEAIKNEIKRPNNHTEYPEAMACFIFEKDPETGVEYYRLPNKTGKKIPIEDVIELFADDIGIVGHIRPNLPSSIDPLGRGKPKTIVGDDKHAKPSIQRRNIGKVVYIDSEAVEYLRLHNELLHMLNDIDDGLCIEGSKNRGEERSLERSKNAEGREIIEQKISPATLIRRLARQKECLERVRVDEYVESEKSDPGSIINRFPRDSYRNKNNAPEVYKWLKDNVHEGDEHGPIFYLKAIARTLPPDRRGAVGSYWISVAKAIKYVEKDLWIRDKFGDPEACEPFDGFEFMVELVRQMDENRRLYTYRSVDTIPQGLWALGKFLGKSGEQISAKTFEWSYIGPARYVLKKKEELGMKIEDVYKRAIKGKAAVNFDTPEGLDDLGRSIYGNMTPQETDGIRWLNDPSKSIESHDYRGDIIRMWMRAFGQRLRGA